MFITKKNRDMLNNFIFHDLFISNVSYNAKTMIYHISFVYDGSYSKPMGDISLYNVLCFKHSHLYPWDSESEGPLIVNCCSCFDDVVYSVNQFNLLNRNYLTIDKKNIYKHIGPPICLDDHFLFCIMLSSGDTIEFLTDKIEIEGIDCIL